MRIKKKKIEQMGIREEHMTHASCRARYEHRLLAKMRKQQGLLRFVHQTLACAAIAEIGTRLKTSGLSWRPLAKSVSPDVPETSLRREDLS